MARHRKLHVDHLLKDSGDLVDLRLLVVSWRHLKGIPPVQHHVEHHTARPNVGDFAVILAVAVDQHLRGHVGERADLRLCHAHGVGLGITEVANFEQRQWEPGADLQQRVFQFDVPVGDAALVAVVCANDELLEEPPRNRLLQPTLLLHILKQTAARRILHCDAYVLACQEHFPELDNVRMAQQAVVQDLRLRILADAATLQKLDGGQLACVAPPRQLHEAEGAVAQLLDFLVRAVELGQWVGLGRRLEAVAVAAHDAGEGQRARARIGWSRAIGDCSHGIARECWFTTPSHNACWEGQVPRLQRYRPTRRESISRVP
mmetsp:Transcript_28526/g.84458  ORF Transcript_28526/g.84458 Transcript_28526/m.84458 type:complete len:318 (+) Transcript_28526:454-1407(+)